MPSGDAAERSPNSPDRPSIDPMQKTRNRRPNSRWPSAIRAGWRWVLTLGLLCACAGMASAEEPPITQHILSLLEAEGFENLHAEEDAEKRVLTIRFENRRYRWEVAGLGVLLALVSREYEGQLVVIPLHTGLPMARIEVSAADYRAFLRGELEGAEFSSRMRVMPTSPESPSASARNASAGRVDIQFAPGLRVNLATPAPPGVFTGAEVRANTSLAVQLGKGLAFEGTYVYPLSNSKPTFSRIAGTWNARLGRNGYFQFQGGRLSHELDGIAAQVSYLSDTGSHHVGASVAQASYPGWKRTTSHQLFYAWRLTGTDLTATISGGRYLRGDQGYSFSIHNGFAENGIEFFYTTTTLSRTTGVVFTVPLGWMRQPRPCPVRMHFKNAFGFAYTDERPYPLDGGLSAPFYDSYQTAIRRWTSAYLRAYVGQMREAGRRWVSEPEDARQAIF